MPENLVLIKYKNEVDLMQPPTLCFLLLYLVSHCTHVYCIYTTHTFL